MRFIYFIRFVTLSFYILLYRLLSKLSGEIWESLVKFNLCTPWMHGKSLQLCQALCDPMDCSPPGSSVHRILQARILEWVTISFFRGSSQSRSQTQASHIVGRFFTIWATRESQQFYHTNDNLPMKKLRLREARKHAECHRLVAGRSGNQILFWPTSLPKLLVFLFPNLHFPPISLLLKLSLK